MQTASRVRLSAAGRHLINRSSPNTSMQHCTCDVRRCMTQNAQSTSMSCEDVSDGLVHKAAKLAVVQPLESRYKHKQYLHFRGPLPKATKELLSGEYTYDESNPFDQVLQQLSSIKPWVSESESGVSFQAHYADLLDRVRHLPDDEPDLLTCERQLYALRLLLVRHPYSILKSLVTKFRLHLLQEKAVPIVQEIVDIDLNRAAFAVAALMLHSHLDLMWPLYTKYGSRNTSSLAELLNTARPSNRETFVAALDDMLIDMLSTVDMNQDSDQDDTLLTHVPRFDAVVYDMVNTIIQYRVTLRAAPHFVESAVSWREYLLTNLMRLANQPFHETLVSYCLFAMLTSKESLDDVLQPVMERIGEMDIDTPKQQKKQMNRYAIVSSTRTQWSAKASELQSRRDMLLNKPLTVDKKYPISAKFAAAVSGNQLPDSEQCSTDTEQLERNVHILLRQSRYERALTEIISQQAQSMFTLSLTCKMLLIPYYATGGTFEKLIEYLDDHRQLQWTLVYELDKLLGDATAYDALRRKFAVEGNDVKNAHLEHHSMARLIKQLVKHYNLPESSHPNLCLWMARQNQREKQTTQTNTQNEQP